MSLLCLLVLLATCGLVHGAWDNCGGYCGLRALPYDYGYGYGAYHYGQYGMTRVVGGASAPVAAWPWLVSIQHSWVPGTGHMCGGSLINTQWVLTAAHCFRKVSNISLVYVLIGATQLTQPGPGAQVRNVKQLYVHQYYDHASMKNDIALLELEQPVLCSPYIQLACVPDATLRVSELVTCFVAGWGHTAARAATTSDLLQEAQVHLIDLKLCNSSNWYAGQIHSSNLCAGYPEGTIDTCQGDSGGPLMCKDNTADYYWVVGVTSWGEGCARPKQPGIYTSVQHFYDWILTQMGASPYRRASLAAQTWSHYPAVPRPTQNPWTRPPVTQNPWTRPPATQNPWTRPPATQRPWTRPPATQRPWTRPPATQNPWTRPPATQNPWTRPPATQKPWTRPPATQKPWTRPPPTQKPWTRPPATQNPWTRPPATQKPWTRPPATQKPTPVPTPSEDVSSCPFPADDLVEFFTEVKELVREIFLKKAT